MNVEGTGLDSGQVSTPASGNDQAASTSGSVSTPAPIELTADSMVKLPGQDKPVKYGDWYRGFQSEYTKSTQDRANLQRELASLKQAAQQQQQQGQPQTPNKRRQMIDQLKARTYLSGEEAATVIDNMFGEVDETIQTRDQALRLLAQKVLSMDQALTGLNQDRTQQSFAGKIQKAMAANSIPDEFKDFAEFIYLGHEGNDLDQEYPRLLKEYWEKFTAAVRQMDQKKVQSARQGQFPGKGGQGSASKPLDTSRMSAKQTADALWESIKGSNET